MSTSSSSAGSVGFFGLLGIVFIVLKLCKVIDWGWLWVLAPIWGPFGLLMLILLVWGATIIISGFTGKRVRLRMRKADPFDRRRFR